MKESNNNATEITAETPGGAKLRVKSYRLIDIAIAIILGFMIVLLIKTYEHDSATGQALVEVSKAMREQARATREMSCIINSTEKERGSELRERCRLQANLP